MKKIFLIITLLAATSVLMFAQSRQLEPAGGNVVVTNVPHVIVDSGGGGGSTAQAANTSGVTGSMTLCSVTTSAPTYVTAKLYPFNCQTDGSQRIAVTNTVATSVASGANVALGALNDDKCLTSDTTNCSQIAIGKGQYAQLQALNALASTDPCFGLVTTPVDKYLASSTPVVIMSATSAKKNYGCSGLVVVGSTAEIVSIIEGTGSICGTDTAIVWGGDTTASHGFSFAANSGTSIIRFNGKTANVDTCLRTSGSNPITVHLETIQN